MPPVVTIYTASLTFSISAFCPHTVFMCFVWISEQTAIISLYNINWLVCITETECVYCAVRTGYLKIFMCFVWISEQTTIISLYNISWLVCITETKCVYCAVRTELCTFYGTLCLKVAHWWRQSHRLLRPQDIRFRAYIDIRQWRRSQLFAASR